ncbi:MAG: sensor histidine kinase [Tannerellaceae bacterium]
MKRYYVLCSLAVMAIIILQSLYIHSLYDQYMQSECKNIDARLYEAIDLERFHRFVNKKEVKFQLRLTPMSAMSDKMRDSLLAIHPLPPKPAPIAETYDVIGLINAGIIRSTDEIRSHQKEDLFYEQGRPINTHVLDSMLQARLPKNYNLEIEIRNSTDSLLAKTGSIENINYASKHIQVGFKGYQFITVYANIPLSSFIKQSIWILALSLIIIAMPLLSLLYLVTTLRSKQSILKQREYSINGIIHDLKSPLTSLSTMLSLFRITEKEPEKQKLIAVNSNGIARLIKKVEQLLEVSRYNRSKIIIYKNAITSGNLTQYAAEIKETLLTISADKDISIHIENRIESDKVLYVDTMHFETILNILIENSIRYSNNEVNINVRFELSAPNTLSIKVKDDGIGIDKKHLRHIFKQFYRANETIVKGYGIGLSYLRIIALAHGGRVCVVSELGKGSEFEVILNCKKDE